jgi:hypothetical protein
MIVISYKALYRYESTRTKLDVFSAEWNTFTKLTKSSKICQEAAHQYLETK